jgi:MFS transporter, DHA1 family, tetracycline resistance protein
MVLIRIADNIKNQRTKVLKKPQVVIFLTVFIYLLGFGMIIPILPLLSTHYGASAFQAGLLMSVYSLMQFIFSPVWGKLSDKIGRRPILMYCLLGEAVSYILLAQSRSLEMLFVSRILTGFFGASISTASAYISDITPPEERSKGMALIGAAFGMGFLFGPAIGGGLTHYAETISKDMNFITGFSSYGVAILCLLTFVFAYFNLKESLVKKTDDQNKDSKKSEAAENSEKKLNRFENISKFLNMPVVGSLIFTFGLATLAMSMMEATLVLFMKERFSWGIKEVSFGFAYIGICIVFTQGFLVRRLIPKIGERNVLRIGLTFMAIGLTGIAFAQHIWMMAIVQTFLAVGNGFTNPSIMGSVSLLVPPDQQGEALGTTQSLSALGRVIGPALGGLLFGSLWIGSPFIIAGLFLVCALVLVLSVYSKLPMAGKKTDAETVVTEVPNAE